jgi:hypothetical protein
MVVQGDEEEAFLGLKALRSVDRWLSRRQRLLIS